LRPIWPLGLVVEGFGGASVIVRETPAILGTLDARALLRDIWMIWPIWAKARRWRRG
jgi:hypothetical protein